MHFIFLEKKRLKEVKSSMEVNVFFYIENNNLKNIAKSINISEILITADAKILDLKDNDFEEYPENENIFVKIQISDGEKCPRCWKIFKPKSKEHSICNRCSTVLNESSKI